MVENPAPGNGVNLCCQVSGTCVVGNRPKGKTWSSPWDLPKWRRLHL